MAYRIEWVPETEVELKTFAQKFRQTIVRKVEHFAHNLPQSLHLSSVQTIRGQDGLGLSCILIELDVGSGPRVGLAMYESEELLRVYLVGNHDYAKQSYLKAAIARLESPGPT